MKTVMEFLKALDFISSEVKFNFRGKSKYQSLIGCALSIIITLVIIVVSILLAVPVFRLENPKVSTSKIYNKNSTFLNFTTFSPFIIAIVNSQGIPLDNQDQYFNVKIYNTNLINKNGVPLAVPTQINTKKCNENIINNEFGSLSRHFNHLAFQTYLNRSICVPTLNNPFFYIKNQMGSNNSNLITISLEYCSNLTATKPCKSQEEINSIIGNYFIYPIMIDYFFDHSQDNPGNVVLFYRPFPMSNNFLKMLYITYKSVNYTSDNSLIGSDLSVNSYYQINSVQTDVNDKGKGRFSQLSFFEVNISFLDEIQDVYYRSYQTLPQLLAEISGIFNFLFLTMISINYFIEIKLKHQTIFDCFSQKKFYIKQNKIKRLSLMRDKRDLDSRLSLNFFEKDLKHNQEEIMSQKVFQYPQKAYFNDGFIASDNFNSLLFHFQDFIHNYLVNENNKNYYRNLLPCKLNKIISLKLQIAEAFYYQIFDVEFLFNNILDFQIFRNSSRKI